MEKQDLCRQHDVVLIYVINDDDNKYSKDE